MKSISSTMIAANLLWVANAGAEPSVPYLETAPITMLWQFNQTTVTVPRADAVAAAAAAAAYFEDPDGLNPVERITTETGKPATYPYATGNQAFFIKYLLRNVLERYAEGSKSSSPVVAAAYNAKVEILKRELSDKWELTAVRRPQTTLAGVMSEDYRIFLTRIDPLRSRTIRGYDTGLRLVNKYTAPKTTETLSGGTLVKVTGTVTTYFTLEFNATYAADPLYLVTAASRPAAVDGDDYNKNGERWHVAAGGYMTYSVRNTVGTPVAIAPTKAKITGFGSWYRTVFDLTEGTSETFSGIAPLNIKMGEVKYQRSEYLPEFFEL